MKRKLILSLMAVLPIIGYSQQSRLNYADRMFETESYYYAAEGYEDVLDRKTDSMRVADRIAFSYDKMGEVEKAASWYSYIAAHKELTAEQYIRLSLLERQLGNYSKSDQLLESYASKYGSNDLSVTYGSLSPDYLNQLLEDQGRFEIRNLSVNKSDSEMGLSYLDSATALVACNKRSRMATSKVFSWDGDYFYDLYKATIKENGELGRLKAVKSKVETKYHDGPGVYNPATGYLYFTRNNYLNRKRGTDDQHETLLKVYKVKYDGKRYGKVEELSINDDHFSTAHPTLSADGKGLIFSSDRPGGFGGMDLYYVSLDNEGNTVGEPQNLGNQINTSRNEVFPTVNAAQKMLFYSSDGLVGLGGLDVFYANLQEANKAGKPQNLGSPLNSRSDDFSFILGSDNETGYFASNRQGGEGSDDIYFYRLLKPFKKELKVEGIITDLAGGEILPGALVTMTDDQGKVLTARADENGQYEFPLEEDRDYRIAVSKDDYFDGGKKISTRNLKNDESTLNGDVALQKDPGNSLYALVTDSKTHAPLDSVQLTIIDNRTGEVFLQTVTPSSGDALKGIADKKIGDKVSYTISMERRGYFPKVVKFDHTITQPGVINVHDLLDGGRGLEMDPEVGDLRELIVIDDIRFDYDKYNIRPDAAAELDKIVEVMNKYPGMVIELGSHTDCRGSKAYNMALSNRRAKASADYIKKRIVNPDRIYGKGYGESKLLNGCACEGAVKSTCSEEEHQQNRRTEFRVVAFDSEKVKIQNNSTDSFK